MAAQEIHDLYIIYVSKFAQKQYGVVKNGLESASHIKDGGEGRPSLEKPWICESQSAQRESVCSTPTN